MPKHTMATTTPLVLEVFETIFADQIDDSKKGGSRKKRCNSCEGCMLSDCGMCRNCKDMSKFGGSGKSKQACIMRK